MENNHPHYVWALVAILAIGMVAWIYSSNRPDTENYAKGSTHPEQTAHNNALINIQPGCQNIKAEETMRLKHGINTNSAK